MKSGQSGDLPAILSFLFLACCQSVIRLDSIPLISREDLDLRFVTGIPRRHESTTYSVI